MSVAGATHASKGAPLRDGVESLGKWRLDTRGKSRVNGKNEGTLYATVVFSAPGNRSQAMENPGTDTSGVRVDAALALFNHTNLKILRSFLRLSS